MKIVVQENALIAPLVSFKMGGPARFLAVINESSDLVEALEFSKEKKVSILPLGKGTNSIFSDQLHDVLDA